MFLIIIIWIIRYDTKCLKLLKLSAVSMDHQHIIFFKWRVQKTKGLYYLHKIGFYSFEFYEANFIKLS